jgi:Trypsin-like peptidase domain
MASAKQMLSYFYRPMILLFSTTVLVALGLLVGSGMTQSIGVTSNVLLRVKRIIAGPASGTAFTIEVDKRQHIVTAKHVVATLNGDTSTIQLCEDHNKCADVQVTVLRCDDPIDIAVLVPSHQVSITHKLEPELKGMIVGQDVYFVGFPYADYSLTTNTEIQSIGFVRKALFSAQERKPNYTRIYLDGRNNSGFSGGPVVYVQAGTPTN